VAVSESVALQIGVGSAALPDGKTMFTDSVVPLMVPVNVPDLFIWHEEHEPSSGSTAFVAAVPDSADPVCVIVSDNVCRPSMLEPGPLQLPPTCVRTLGAGADGEELQAASASATAAVTTAIEDLVITLMNDI
jgi:hypothetical protein